MVLLGSFLAQHGQDAVEIPTTTGCPDFHVVECKEFSELVLVGSAGRRLKLTLQFENTIECLRRQGLNDLPDTIMSRSVVVRMRRRAPGEVIEPWRLRINGPEASELHQRLSTWAEDAAPGLSWPVMPTGIEDRNADVWEALLAVADLAGSDWPERARVAAVALVADSAAGAPSIGVLLLHDLRAVFAGRDKMPTEDILTGLHAVEESPWAELRGKPVDARWLSRQLAKYDIKPKVIRIDDGNARGYDAADLHDPWSRYLVTSVTDVTHPMGEQPNDVTHVAEPLWKLRQTTKTSVTPVLGVPPIGHVTGVTAKHLNASDAGFPSVPTEGSQHDDLDHCAVCGKILAPLLIEQRYNAHPRCLEAAS